MNDEPLRIEFETHADISESGLRLAVEMLHSRDVDAETLVVHPYAKHMAQHVSYFSGLKLPVEINWSFREDEWLVRGQDGTEAHSEGA